jgi:type II secretion system protein C
MTKKKKSFFSNIKSKFSKSEDLDDEYEEIIEGDEDEYEYIDEDEEFDEDEYELVDEDDTDIEITAKSQQDSTDQHRIPKFDSLTEDQVDDTEDEEDMEYSSGTIELEIEEKPVGFIDKVKSLFSKGKNHEEFEEYEEVEEIDEDEIPEEEFEVIEEVETEDPAAELGNDEEYEEVEEIVEEEIDEDEILEEELEAIEEVETEEPAAELGDDEEYEEVEEIVEEEIDEDEIPEEELEAIEEVETEEPTAELGDDEEYEEVEEIVEEEIDEEEATPQESEIYEEIETEEPVSELGDDEEYEEVEEITEEDIDEEEIPQHEELYASEQDESYQDSPPPVDTFGNQEQKENLVNTLKEKASGLFKKKVIVEQETQEPELKKTRLVDSLMSKLNSKKSSFPTNLGKIAPSEETNKKIKALSPEQLLPLFMGATNRSRVHKLFLSTLVFLLFFNIGKFAGIMLSKTESANQIVRSQVSPAKNNFTRDIAVIKSKNIFNAKDTLEQKIAEKKVEKPKVKEIKICKEASTPSSLPVELLHTVVLQDSVKSVASVNQRGKIVSFREGDKIDGVAEIGKIDRLKLIIKNLRSGQCEFISSSKKKSRPALKSNINIIPAAQGKDLLKKTDNRISGEGNKFKIKKSLRDELLGNIGDVLTQARAIQIKNPDGSLSFRMTEVVPGSIYSQLNIQNDDIITAINGKKITNINELMAMFGQLKNNDQYDITVKRSGNEQTFNYNFTE